MLQFNPDYNTWTSPVLWMSDATFKRYVDAWLEARGITAPMPTQYLEAVEACRKLSYWQHYGDRSVHWIQTGS